MKKILYLLVTLIGIGIIFISTNESVNAYTCKTGYYCNTNGGEVKGTFWVPYGVGCLTLSNQGYGCSGTDSSCNGGFTYYRSKEDCLARTNPYSAGCCDKITCVSTCGTNCDLPSCESGYTTDSSMTGVLCRTNDVVTVSCSYPGSNCPPSAGCGGKSGKCYLLETNLQFTHYNQLDTSGPSSVSMVVDSKEYPLSTDPNNPTHIKLPASGSSNVQVSVPTFDPPTTSRGSNYYFQVNNYGTNDEWKTWTSCDSSEDFCTKLPDSNNVQSFIPNSKTVNQVLKEGATGQVSAKYATTDKCSDTYKFSVAIEGYYVVDTIPDIPPIVTPDDIFPDITTDVTAKGCTSLTYTGLDINNSLHVVTTSNDTNSNDEISAFTLWFSKDDTVPNTESISGTYSGSSNQDLGIMIKKNGNDWSNPYIYATNTSPFTFAQLSGEYITINGSNVARIYDVSVTQGTNVTFDYKIEFLTSTEALSGMYNVYGGVLDSYMINDPSLDQSYFTSLTDWGIDLVNPVVNDITQQVNDPTSTYITWSVADTISGIDKTVINAYRVGGLNTSAVSLYIPTTYTTNKGLVELNNGNTVPDTNQIGLYMDTNTWIFNGINGEKDLLNIGNNEIGNILIYTTPYDRACNTANTSENIDLNPWLATRGGAVYSSGNISSTSKDVSTTTALDGVFNAKTQMTKDKIDLGTELLATRGANISDLMHSTVSKAVRALGVNDNNDQQNTWYTQLYRKFEKQRNTLTNFNIAGKKTTDSCIGTKCYEYSQEDIHMPQGYVCDVPTLIMSEKNIYIEPSITGGTGLSGCIFLAKNNIYIGAGQYMSDTKIKYDYIEGFFIADNQIIFPLVDQSQVLRDGVEIYGGLVAMGSNITDGKSALSIERNMRLFNQTNPTIVTTYDNRYASLSYIFFGTSSQLYKQEVGFKTGD